MRVLVTGGAGFIGRHTVSELGRRGMESRVYDIAADRNDDIRNADRVRCAAEGCDAIIHLAALVGVRASLDDPLAYHDTNATGTLNVLEAARRNGIKRVAVASTVAELTPYAVAKRAAEEWCRAYEFCYGLRPTILRYANVYGPGQRADAEGGVVAIFAEAIRRGEPVRINGRQHAGDGGCFRDYIWVGDIAEATVTAATDPQFRAALKVLGTGAECSTSRLARLMGATLVFHAEPRAGDVGWSVVETGDFEKLTGHHALPLADGLKRMGFPREA